VIPLKDSTRFLLYLIVTLGLIYATPVWSQSKREKGEALYKEISSQYGKSSDDIIISQSLTYLKGGYRLRRIQVLSYLAQSYDRKGMTNEALSTYSIIWQTAMGYAAFSIPAISRTSDILWERNRPQIGKQPADRQLAAQSLHKFLDATRKIFPKLSKTEQESWIDLESKFLKFKKESNFTPVTPSQNQKTYPDGLEKLLGHVGKERFDWNETRKWLDSAEGQQSLQLYQHQYDQLNFQLRNKSLKRLIACNHLSTIPLLSSLLSKNPSSQQDVLNHLNDYLQFSNLNSKFGKALASSVARLAVSTKPKSEAQYLSCLAFAVIPSMDLNLAKKSLAKIDEDSSQNLIGSIFVGFNRASAALPDRFFKKSIEEWKPLHPKSSQPPTIGPHSFFLMNYMTSAYDEAFVARARNNPKAILEKLANLDPDKDFFQQHGEIYLAAHGLPNSNTLKDEVAKLVLQGKSGVPSEFQSYYLTPALLKDLEYDRTGNFYSTLAEPARTRVAGYLTIPPPQDCTKLFQELKIFYQGKHTKQSDLRSPQLISSYFKELKPRCGWDKKGNIDRFQNTVDIFAAKNAEKFKPFVKHLVH